jgi:hypothetical protein
VASAGAADSAAKQAAGVAATIGADGVLGGVGAGGGVGARGGVGGAGAVGGVGGVGAGGGFGAGGAGGGVGVGSNARGGVGVGAGSGAGAVSGTSGSYAALGELPAKLGLSPLVAMPGGLSADAQAVVAALQAAVAKVGVGTACNYAPQNIIYNIIFDICENNVKSPPRSCT